MRVELSHCTKLYLMQSQMFFLPCWLLISTFDITLAIKLLVCHLFRKCFAMFLIFTLLGTRKSLWEAHTSHLFSLFRELASASVIRQTAPLIYCCWDKENIISNDGHFRMTKVILVLKNIKPYLFSHLKNATHHEGIIPAYPWGWVMDIYNTH